MKIALLTAVFNEKLFFPIWLKYYRQHFSDKDIYILDNESFDGCLDNVGCNVIPLSNNGLYDAKWLSDKVSEHQARLLNEYDYVVYAEVDEIITSKNFIEDIEQSGKSVIRCNGYEVIQIIGKETPLDLSAPLLKQRTKWYRSRLFCKPIISRVPLLWRPGFHKCQVECPIDEAFTLIHLHRIDFDISISRINDRLKKQTSKETLDNGWGWQNWQTEAELKKTWYRWFQPMSALEDIPESIKELI
jgi:hypothetical protein